MACRISSKVAMTKVHNGQREVLQRWYITELPIKRSMEVISFFSELTMLVQELCLHLWPLNIQQTRFIPGFPYHTFTCSFKNYCGSICEQWHICFTHSYLLLWFNHIQDTRIKNLQSFLSFHSIMQASGMENFDNCQ